MPVKPKPDGYHSVTPYLVVSDASRLVEFVRSAFGAVVSERLETPAGKVAHGEVRIGDSVVMFADEQPAWKAQPAMLLVYVDDVDGTFGKALAAGATSIREPADQFYGDRTATFVDPTGNVWTVACHVEDVARDEMARRFAAMASKGS